MLKQIIFIVVLLAALGFFAFTMKRLLDFFKLTKGSVKDRIDQVKERVVHTLLVAFGQTKILRKPIAGAMHATIYWGFLVITVGTVEMVIDGVLGTERILGFLGPLYDVVTLSGEVMALAIIFAVGVFLSRRYIVIPKRFIAPEMKKSSNIDATIVLIFTFFLMVSLLMMNYGYMSLHPGGDYEGLYPVSWLAMKVFGGQDLHLIHEIGWWVHIVLVLAFLNLLPYSKHFHVILSTFNVFFKKLEPAGKLNNIPEVTTEIQLMMDPSAPMPEEAGDPPRFGVKDVEDVSWKNLLDSYTCTECGRCSEVCPANSTGKKLSPRKIMKDLRARMTEKGPEMVKNKEYDDGKSLFDYTTPEELWACTTCGACMQECPVEIEHVPLIINLRQYLVMEESSAPQELNSMFNNIENNGAPWPMPASARFDWANDISRPA